MKITAETLKRSGWTFPTLELRQGVEPFEEKTDRRKGVFYRREWVDPEIIDGGAEGWMEEIDIKKGL